ncbi:hypothetical protein TPA0910_15520 [Streptomyces hygroscopicus subsp. sporocinereus]|uniref:Recombinase domain-containing protein n=1 Tax=Streptomyces hygroscopicus TaxID=1912 RepID=A0ABQ3TUV5_STRHY|nr:recombinase family protein [Streptomyces hygroscopicus]GHJ27119.1 hypothetical protein TPA0910_15520 [Streptomyces hygroscopicus]
MAKLRVLGGVRQSVTQDNSVSVESQKREVIHWTAAPSLNAEVVGWAIDTDVSGSIDPFKRPELSPWLTERVGEWDVLCAPRIDRLSRKLTHFSQLLDWAEDNGKYVATADGMLNTRAPGGATIAKVMAVFAEEELRKIRGNIQNGMLTLRELARWMGGPHPFGYISYDTGDDHKRLKPEETYAPILREICKRVTDGESTYALADDFNARGLLVWSDHLRVLKGKEPTGVRWKPAVIARTIQKPICAGYLTFNGEVWENEEGEPTVIADPPILTLAEWEGAVSAISGRTRQKNIRRRDTTCQLTGIALCGCCGTRMVCHHVTKTLKSGAEKQYRDYTCTAKNRAVECADVARIPEKTLEGLFEGFLMHHLGDLPEVQKRVDPGESHAAELLRLKDRRAMLDSEDEEGMYDDDRESYHRKRKNLNRKIAELEAKPVRPARTWYEKTGRTWRDMWAVMATKDQREYLAERNVKVFVFKNAKGPHSGPGVVIRFGELKEFATAAGLDASEVAALDEVHWNTPDHWANPGEWSQEIASGELPPIPAVLTDAAFDQWEQRNSEKVSV